MTLPIDAKLRLVHRMAAMGQISASVVHEVKNAMTGVIGAVQVAKTKVDDPKKLAELLPLIEREALRSRTMLMGFLAMARQPAPSFTVCELNGMVSDAVDLFRHHLRLSNTKVAVQLTSESLEVRGDRPQLSQVLLNLALNAVEAMAGGGEVRVSTWATPDGFACVGVSDTGIGIPPELRDRIFEPFFTTKSDSEGTGLGLSISRDIAHEHHGELLYQARPEGGTTFILQLPRVS